MAITMEETIEEAKLLAIAANQNQNQQRNDLPSDCAKWWRTRTPAQSNAWRSQFTAAMNDSTQWC